LGLTRGGSELLGTVVSMQYRRFGRTEIRMPVFTCGGMRYQHEWQDLPLDQVPPESQANLEATVRRAVELGINHIETARGYGSSERQLGLALSKLPRDEIVVQTKIAPAADPNEFVTQFHESLERLQLESVDLLALHGVNNHELLWWSVRPGGCLAAARRLVAEGKVRHVGFSTHAAVDVILAAIGHDDDGGFDYVNLHWYYIFQDNWPAIEAATRRDMGVFIISPTDKGGMLNVPPQRLVDLCQPLHPIVFNCLFCLQRPEVHTLSIGAARPGDFDSQLSVLGLLDRAGELLPPIETRLREALISALGNEPAQRYAEGLPPWHKTPGYLNMAKILWLRNLALAYDMIEYGKMRYNLLGNGGHWFAGLNAAHVDGLDLEEALANSPFKEKIPEWLRQTHAMLYQKPEKRLSES
jgi:predicted aldo/keto reductase-like oxidoreductase